jgi:hypothetical protein
LIKAIITDMLHRHSERATCSELKKRDLEDHLNGVTKHVNGEHGKAALSAYGP